MTRRAQVLVAPRRLEAIARPPAPLPPFAARLAVRAAGVCGTDLALWSGSYPVPLPLVLGHEFYGTVVALGDAATDADRALLGRLATAEINNTCLAERRPRQCAFCARGLPEHCAERTVTGIIRHDGAFADEVVVPLGALHALPEGDPAWAEPLGFFVEPLAAALQTFVRRPLVPGENVLVLGLGRLGLLIAAVAQRLGARVLGVARGAARRERAAAWGIDTVAHDATGDALAAAVRDWSGGVGADVVVEVTGRADLFDRATRLVRPRGTVCLKSTPGLDAPAPLTHMVVAEVDVSCSRCGPFAAAIDFQRRHRLPLASMITGEMPLERLAEAFDAAGAPEAGKVLVRVA